MMYGLLGKTLAHSFSPEIHRHIADYSYELCELNPDQLDVFLKEKNFRGVNVTIPYKQTVIPYLDEIDPAAARIGAVNTIVNRNGRLCGYNTDYQGAAALLRHAGISLRDKRVLLLGNGGTANTLRAVATDAGAQQLVTVSRRGEPNTVSYDEALRLTDTQVILNTTPVGMFPQLFDRPLSLAPFTALEGVADVIYNPLRTPLIRSAKARGIAAEGGLYMLVAQAVYASALFRDIPADDTVIETVYRRIMQEKQTIVLIGMPSCGKTSVGTALASALSRQFVDSDCEIVRRAGKPVPRIFEEDGERAFRDLESDVLADLSKQQGLLLATGGGAILRDSNVDMLRANGTLWYLNRPFADLIPTGDRPLSSNTAALERLYRERHPRYEAVADRICPAHGSVQEVTARLIKELIP